MLPHGHRRRGLHTATQGKTLSQPQRGRHSAWKFQAMCSITWSSITWFQAQSPGAQSPGTQPPGSRQRAQSPAAVAGPPIHAWEPSSKALRGTWRKTVLLATHKNSQWVLTCRPGRDASLGSGLACLLPSRWTGCVKGCGPRMHHHMRPWK